jgi:hypothetical protein
MIPRAVPAHDAARELAARYNVCPTTTNNTVLAPENKKLM